MGAHSGHRLDFGHEPSIGYPVNAAAAAAALTD
jgi:hypothetical protein